MMKIFLIGDSTMQYNSILTYPQCGWGQVLNLFFKEGIEIINLAKNGRSTKSFINENRFASVVDNLNKSDYVVCQFGHNDPKNDPLRFSSIEDYIKNLDYFKTKIEEKGGKIIFCTSIARLIFEGALTINTHLGYPEAMLDYAKSVDITCIDLHSLTRNVYDRLQKEECEKFHMVLPKGVFVNHPNGLNDTTHLVYEGAIIVASLFVDELKKTNEELKNYLL